MHFIEIEFFRRRHAHQKREMRGEEYQEGDNGIPRRRIVRKRK